MKREPKGEQRSTRQLLVKVPNFPGLYRHSISKVYYGVKKIHGKRKEHSFQTDDRKLAERKFWDWVDSLAEIDVEAAKTTLKELIKKFVSIKQGKPLKTRRTVAWLVKTFEDTWSHDIDMRVSDIRPSHLDEWLALHEGRLENTSYNSLTGFLKQLFEIAVADRMIDRSPFDKVKTKWKKPQKPRRHIPTQEQFEAIVADVRSQRFNAEAEDSADFIEFLGLAGLGQAEASSLTWGDVDWTKEVMHIKRRKTGARFQVPIYKHLRPLLDRLYKKYPLPPPFEEKVFKIKDAKKALEAACERLKFTHFSQRDVRAVLIRRLWRANVDKKLISKWQGHQDGGKLIIDTYTEVFGADDEEYVKRELEKI